MVRFEKDRYIIEIHTGCNPIEDYLLLQQSLLDLLSNVNQDNIISDTFYRVPDFLAELIPDWETAKKMTE